MKKVMMGILIIIPIVILLIVALVTNFLSIQAWVAVESMQVSLKGTDSEAESIALNFADLVGGKSFYDFFDVTVMPEKANHYTVEWYISGDIQYQDADYKKKYDDYIEALENNADADDLEIVYPAVMLVDDNGNEIQTSNTGHFVVNTYCSFTLVAQAEQVTKSILVDVVGYDVKKITLSAPEGKDALRVGESMRLLASYTPIDSIVTEAEWTSSDESAVSVDANGIITAKAEASGVTISMRTVNGLGETVEGSYIVNVQKGASEKFGNKLVTSKEELAFEELGVSEADIDGERLEGCLLTNSGIVLNEGVETAYVTMKDGNVLTIGKCGAGDIAIEHFEHINSASGYVLAVGELKLSLNVRYADMLNGTLPTVEKWHSSDETVATVDGGVVTALSDGYCTITATAGDAEAKVELNVRNKVTSVRLLSNQASLAIGLARETVFASDRYVNIDADTSKTPNSFVLRLVGEPKRADFVSEEEYAIAYAHFYNAYNFDVETAEYIDASGIRQSAKLAHFDENTPNMVIFDGDKLEGLGKQLISLTISAKYPKYELYSSLTTANLAVTAVYGVEVKDMKELRAAAKEQKAYAEAHTIEGSDSDLFTTDPSPKDGISYVARMDIRSDRQMAITLGDNVSYYEGEFANADNTPVLYGSLYGNNHMISASGQQVGTQYYGTCGVINIGYSDVTLSNTIIRSRELNGDSIADDPYGNVGTAIVIMNGFTDYQTRHMLNDTIEYCIVENGRIGIRPYNVDFTLRGSVMRNFQQMAICSYTSIWSQTNNYDWSNITLDNVVCSNCLGTLMSDNFRFIANDDHKNNEARFILDDKDANFDWFKQQFLQRNDGAAFPKIIQKGFCDIYNWQNIEYATIFDLGDETYNSLLQQFAAPLLKYNSLFANCRYLDTKYDDNGNVVSETAYMHMGFMLTGIYGGQLSQPFLFDVRLEDDRFCHVRAADLRSDEGNQGDIAARILAAFHLSLEYYSFNANADLTPFSTYEINSRFVSHLHGEA